MKINCELLYKVTFYNWRGQVRHQKFVRKNVECDQEGLDPEVIVKLDGYVYDENILSAKTYDDQPEPGQFNTPNPEVTFMQYLYR